MSDDPVCINLNKLSSKRYMEGINNGEINLKAVNLWSFVTVNPWFTECILYQKRDISIVV